MGIVLIGFYFLLLVMKVEEFVEFCGEDFQKYLVGLGCSEIVFCLFEISVIDFGVEVVCCVFDCWDGSLEDIGFIVVGMELVVDMSCLFSVFIVECFGLCGVICFYEVKYVCYGGIFVLCQVIEWCMLGVVQGKVVFVIVVDVVFYEEGDVGEVIQGVGVVVFVVDKFEVVMIEIVFYVWSEFEFDFFCLVGDFYLMVDGFLSQDCY